ncbi:DUF2442 domain-containing protein [Ventrimonas sp. CLA-AP-H27]|uniref:DUF2442 domain-containing protein n=1 Tax=Ventrimonas faecis TaxID=3133170 RepID=A0ABV1HR19_9FIRM
MNEYFFPVVVQVRPLDNFHVEVYFNDGKIVDYDAGADLQGGVFAPLGDLDTFKRTCTVMNDTLAWDLEGNRDETKCLDIDPCMLHDLEAINDRIA